MPFLSPSNMQMRWLKAEGNFGIHVAFIMKTKASERVVYLVPVFFNALFNLSEFFAGGAEGFFALGEVEADVAVLGFAEET